MPGRNAPSSSDACPQQGAQGRLGSIDILRGIVMVIMALDHVRDFFHAESLQFNPLAPERTYPVLFATRWISHVWAPVFVLLAGVSAYLQFARGKPRAKLSCGSST